MNEPPRTPDDFHTAFRTLSAGQLGPPPDPRQLAYEVVRRDQRRTRVLAAISLALWVLATAGLLLLLAGLDDLVMYLRNAVPIPTSRPFPRPYVEMIEGTSPVHHILPWAAAAVVALMAAAALTVYLVFHARRAPLNRINVTLTELSEQLKHLRESGGGGPR